MTSEWTVELPAEWQTAPFRPNFCEPIGEIKLPRGRSALLTLGLLKDGTNVLALSWDRGTRLARVSPDTGWALEERFTGRPPGPGEGALLKAWRSAIDALVQAGKDAAAELASPDFTPTPAVFCMNDEAALDAAYAAYCERAEPVSREVFELGVEILAREETDEARRG